MPVSVVGRDAELAALSEFLTGISEGASVLVLEGEAGMGKTTLFEASLARARELERRVLVARPSESETDLSFAGLGDLLGVALDDVLDSMPSAQRRALSRALVLEDDDGSPLDPRAVGVAVQSALRALTASGPTVLAVDDVQWLDTPSAGALSFACRRLGDAPVAILLARRTGLATRFVEDIRRSLDVSRAVELGPLDVLALHRLLHDRLGTSLPRPLLAEVCDASGGNPFFAIEIVRTLQHGRTTVEAGQPLPVPESLHEILDERLRALPPESQDFLLAAAAHAHPTVAITTAATGVDVEAGLRPALAAGIVELDGSRMRFVHPLLAACAYEIGDLDRRRAIHVRLSELLDDPEARAWQLAAATQEPDDGVAATLEEAAHRARARGAPRPAALLLERASELTTAAARDERIRRAIDASYLHFEAGDSARAGRALRELLEVLPDGGQRARALWALAKIRSYESADEAAELFLEVVDLCAGDDETRARAHEGVAASLWIAGRRIEEAWVHATKAVKLARALGDDVLGADALISQLGTETWMGRASAAQTAERALALQSATVDSRVNDQPLVGLAEYWLFVGRHAEAREALDSLLRLADDTGDESSRPYLLFLLSSLEGALGDYAQAVERSQEGRDAALQSGQPVFAAYNVALMAVHAASLGRRDDVLRSRDEALALAPANGHVTLMTTAARGHVALAAGEREAAVDLLRRARTTAVGEGIGEPEVMRYVIDEVEALVELGRVDEAVEHLAWYEGSALDLERISALANCGRCRGLLAAQAGDVEAALALYEGALTLHAKVELPLDRGRTLLALGAAQRRAKRRREARATLEEALAVFEKIGAALWAERARGELGRISGRAATPGALTPAEQRVAALVAEGKTNREVAAALYLSDRTVEGHLSRIFGKLGIRHRTEVAGALQTRGIDLSNTGDTPVSAETAAP
jgi:DNA-binding CsgD family transcriptional regulator